MFDWGCYKGRVPPPCMPNEAGSLEASEKFVDVAQPGMPEDISPSQLASGSVHGDGMESTESDSSRKADSELSNEDRGAGGRICISSLFAGTKYRCGRDTPVSGIDFRSFGRNKTPCV